MSDLYEEAEFTTSLQKINDNNAKFCMFVLPNNFHFFQYFTVNTKVSVLQAYVKKFLRDCDLKDASNKASTNKFDEYTGNNNNIFKIKIVKDGKEDVKQLKDSDTLTEISSAYTIYVYPPSYNKDDTSKNSK